LLGLAPRAALAQEHMTKVGGKLVPCPCEGPEGSNRHCTCKQFYIDLYNEKGEVWGACGGNTIQEAKQELEDRRRTSADDASWSALYANTSEPFCSACDTERKVTPESRKADETWRMLRGAYDKYKLLYDMQKSYKLSEDILFGTGTANP